MMRRVLRMAPVVLGAALAVSLALPLPAVRAVAATLYVDGRTGNDANDGSSWAEAFKTISAAAVAIPRGSAPGWRVVVRGYTDYVYRERPVPGGFRSYGATGAPISFEAAGWAGGGDFVRPIVSGADRAPLSGQSWHSASAGVYWTTWPTRPENWGSKTARGDNGHSAIFQNRTRWLWDQPSLALLNQQARAGKSGYYWDDAANRLYVAPFGGSVGGQTFHVIMRQGFYFRGDQGVAHVAVRGFRVEHTSNGIAFTMGADYGVIEDNVLVGNMAMGIMTNGRTAASGADPSVGHIIRRNSVSYSTVQGMKIDHGTTDTRICANTVVRNAYQGIKVTGSGTGQPNSGITTRITVCNNLLADQTYRRPWMANDNASGITIANGARNVTVVDNRIRNNGFGIHLASEEPGLLAIMNVVIEGNLVWDNRRIGLNMFDGFHGSVSGSVVSRHNLYYRNEVGVQADVGLTNRRLEHDTVWGNDSHGIVVFGRGDTTTLTVTRTIVAGNGGQGVRATRGGSASLSYDGLYGNDGGNLYGVTAPASVNFQPPGFRSTNAASADFLRIRRTSFQYTAGPGDSPIGARW